MNKFRVYKNVKTCSDIVIEDFCIIGIKPEIINVKNIETIIGKNARIRSHTVIYAGNIIGDNFETGHKVNIREFNIIGHNVSIGTHSIIEHNIIIGNNVRIHSQVFIPEYTSIEDNAWIGPNAVLTNALYPQSPDAKKKLKGPVIKRGAIIGANVTILPGIIIGENSLIGAGSVITENVPDGVVAAGNPGKIINKISNLPYN